MPLFLITLNTHGGWSLAESKEAVQNIWEKEIHIEDFNHYIDSLLERLRLVDLEKVLKRSGNRAALGRIISIYRGW